MGSEVHGEWGVGDLKRLITAAKSQPRRATVTDFLASQPSRSWDTGKVEGPLRTVAIPPGPLLVEQVVSDTPLLCVSLQGRGIVH